MIAILDCGTTNTKCYLVEADKTLVNERYSNFGVKENALKSGREKYKEKLKDMVFRTVAEAGREEGELTAVIAFGMISSDLGLTVLPHIAAPAGLKELKAGVCQGKSGEIFGEAVEFYIVRGVKNALAKERSLENVGICDFMRGEETQVMGILETYHPREAFNAIVFSSHFKIIHVSSEGKILGSMTTMSGQIYDCMLNHTVVGKSVCVPGGGEKGTLHVEEIISLARRITEERGMNRALLCPRFMELFTEMTAEERLTYLETVIGLEDLKSMREFYGDGIYSTKQYYFVGQEGRCRLFGRILSQVYPDAVITIVSGKAASRDLSVAGALKIIDL